METSEIEVFCRIRPLNSMERRRGDRFIADFPTKETVAVGGRAYTFNRVFDPAGTQEELYTAAAADVVQNVLSGYNGTIFAYGQTSSGKTHTMEGSIHDAELQGIVPRIISDIFLHINEMDPDLEFIVKATSFEIYNENIRDLLNVQNSNLQIRENMKKVTYVQGITERAVTTPQELMDIVEEAKNNRSVMATNMNEESSRSHSVLTIKIQQTHTVTNKQRNGCLHLVDLAGSEKIAKTGVNGVSLKEARNINLSLTSLGLVISALATKKAHVPYRDSKLTRILQQALGGNSRTTVIICASPSHLNEAETKSTLSFGSRAKTISNNVIINEELTADGWRVRYENDVSKLRSQLEAAHNKLKRCSVTTSEKTLFEEDVADLYRQLDEKDAEIDKLKQESDQWRNMTALHDDELLRLRNQDVHHRQLNANLQQIIRIKENEFDKLVLVKDDLDAQLQQHLAMLKKTRSDLEDAQQELTQQCERTRLQHLEYEVQDKCYVDEIRQILQLVDSSENSMNDCFSGFEMLKFLRSSVGTILEKQKSHQLPANISEGICTPNVEISNFDQDVTTNKIALLVEQTRKKLLDFNAIKSEFGRHIHDVSPFRDDSIRRQDPHVLFLVNNMEKLTMVHKQLFRENSDFRVMLSHMETRLNVRGDRIQRLEDDLLKSKERSQMDRASFNQEIELLKRSIYKSRQLQCTPTIIKTIRPHQIISSSAMVSPMVYH